LFGSHPRVEVLGSEDRGRGAGLHFKYLVDIAYGDFHPITLLT